MPFVGQEGVVHEAYSPYDLCCWQSSCIASIILDLPCCLMKCKQRDAPSAMAEPFKYGLPAWTPMRSLRHHLGSTLSVLLIRGECMAYNSPWTTRCPGTKSKHPLPRRTLAQALQARSPDADSSRTSSCLSSLKAAVQIRWGGSIRTSKHCKLRTMSLGIFFPNGLL